MEQEVITNSLRPVIYGTVQFDVIEFLVVWNFTK